MTEDNQSGSKNLYQDLLALIIEDDSNAKQEEHRIQNVDISTTFTNTNSEKPDYYSLLKLMGYDSKQESSRYDKYDRHFVEYPKAENITASIPSIISKQPNMQATPDSNVLTPEANKTVQKSEKKKSIKQIYEPHMSNYANTVKNEMLRLTKDISMPKFNSISIKSAGEKKSIAIPAIKEQQHIGVQQQKVTLLTDLLIIPKINGVTNRKIDQKYMVLPSLSVSDQITELERIIEGIKENIFDSGHFEVVTEEVISLINVVNNLKKELKKKRINLGEFEVSLWQIRDQRLNEAMNLIYNRYVSKNS